MVSSNQVLDISICRGTVHRALNDNQIYHSALAREHHRGLVTFNHHQLEPMLEATGGNLSW